MAWAKANVGTATRALVASARTTVLADMTFLSLGVGAAHRRGQAGGGHGAGHAALTLAAHFRAADRGVALVEGADGAGGQQEGAHLRRPAAVEAAIEAQHRRNDPRRPVGGR